MQSIIIIIVGYSLHIFSFFLDLEADSCLWRRPGLIRVTIIQFSVHLSQYLPVCPFSYLSVYFNIRPSIHLNIGLTILTFSHPSVHPVCIFLVSPGSIFKLSSVKTMLELCKWCSVQEMNNGCMTKTNQRKYWRKVLKQTKRILPRCQETETLSHYYNWDIFKSLQVK